MDEPDAHLHPSMTSHFMNVVNDVLVGRYGARVIMTTHSPSTVALAPEGSVFVMSRTQPRITPSHSKAETVGLLTAGLVVVSPGTRFVFVEDSDDVQFYEAVRAVLSDYGPSRDPRALKPAPSLVFLPASLGSGSNKIGGGKDAVYRWVDKFDQPPLDEMFRGIIDRDAANTPTKHIYVLGRHSIENYLLDPFVIFGILLDEGNTPAVAGMSISRGDEHLLRTMPEADLQEILNAIRAKVEPSISHLTPAETATCKVSFTNGKSIEYPQWMINRRGHDLLSLYQLVFGGVKVISPPRLRGSMHRVRLVPTELADIMASLQG
jgi:hypothetical protein